MTFLEFVCERLMGPPASRSDRRSTWRCPFHNDRHPSFSTRPPKRGFKDRYQCFGCGAWGDEFDLLKLFFPKEDYSARRERVAALRREYESLGYTYTGDRGVNRRRPDDEADRRALDALNEFKGFLGSNNEQTGFKAVAFAAEIAWQNLVSLDRLAGECAKAWLRAQGWSKAEIRDGQLDSPQQR